MKLIVTTSSRASGACVERARRVARRCGRSFVPRSANLARLGQTHGADAAYVVARDREELRSPQERLFVHEAMLRSRLSHGPAHPLVRAVAGPGDDPAAPERILDLSLGTCADALYLAAAFPAARVTGLEGSPVLFSLAEDGLDRMTRGPAPAAGAAARVQPVLAESAEHLRTCATNSHDVAFFDPMFDRPATSPPGYELLRALALGPATTHAVIAEALRVARHRVVLKLALDAPPPPADRVIAGSRVRYAVWENLAAVTTRRDPWAAQPDEHDHVGGSA